MLILGEEDGPIRILVLHNSLGKCITESKDSPYHKFDGQIYNRE